MVALIKILKYIWKRLPHSVKVTIKRKISTLNTLVNPHVLGNTVEISGATDLDVLEEYRELVLSLVSNMQDLHIRIHNLEKNQKSNSQSC